MKKFIVTFTKDFVLFNIQVLSNQNMSYSLNLIKIRIFHIKQIFSEGLLFFITSSLQTQKCVTIALKPHLILQTAETVEAIVTQLMEKQRNARQAALNKQLECGCPETNATNGDKLQCCIHNTTTTAAVSTVRNSQHKVGSELVSLADR